SPLQKTMLFDNVVNPTSGTSFLQTANLHPHLNHALYIKAWEQLLARHTSLRTAFFWDDLSDPLQVVMRKVNLPVEYLTWRGKPDSVWRADLNEFLNDNLHNLFNLEEAPLVRLTLITLDHDRTIVVLNFHHINVDGWSLQLISSELQTIYTALEQGYPPQLPVTRPFHDYIKWLEQQDMAVTTQFWETEMQNFVTPTGLPWVTREAGIFSGFGDHAVNELTLPPALVNNIDTFLNTSRISFPTLLLAAWSLLLARYNDTDDVLCGMVFHGRPTDLAHFERIVGMFINALPSRTIIANDLSILTWLQHTHAHLKEMEKHSFFSAAEIHRTSSLQHAQMLFETMVVDQVSGTTGKQTTSDNELSNAHEKSNLLITLYLRRRDLIWIDYDLDFVDAQTATMLGEHLIHILTQIVNNPAQPVGQVGLLAAEALPAPTHITTSTDILTLFNQQVATTPHKVALRCDATAYTFKELDARANQVAHWLQQQGVGQEQQVGIYMARSAEMVIAMLAILKANAAYVPLSLTDPPERVSFIMKDADITFVLTLQAQLADLAAYPVKTCVLDSPTLDNLSTAPLALSVDPHQLAYIIYTSGSTGQPKGVLIERQSLSAIAKVDAEKFALSAADTVLQFATIVFDTSVEEIFSALIVGATLVIRTAEMLDSIAAFCAALEKNQITTLEMVTAYWHVLVDELVAGRVSLPQSLRQIVVGGEAISAEKVQQWHALNLGIDLHNSYGPTETTVTATSTLLDPATPTDLSIGRPWPTLTAYVLDKSLRPMPTGLPGELYFSGIGLARGYQNRPEETAQQFVPNPFGPGKLYRTGDRVLRRADGQFDFLGRIDMQVKVRGFRVELGAIESRLREHPDVGNAVVVQQTQTQQLVAFIEGATTVDAQALSAWINKKLPLYMIPSAFTPIEQFPINQRGKIDRLKLSSEKINLSSQQMEEFVAPETEIEEKVCEIWCKLLKVEQVSTFDDFFTVGGHSLLATQMVQRINAAYTVNISIRDVFEQPTVAELALLVEEQLIDLLEAV
ncbi:MAG TPA: amino acid adenylation domain-containing protein, partial [Anaerolineae bacterium]|nr:amino acid adenylation domain-containing protein [Anaerolineae bacterium]